jgi:hypothetical protein
VRLESVPCNGTCEKGTSRTGAEFHFDALNFCMARGQLYKFDIVANAHCSLDSFGHLDEDARHWYG